MRTSPAFLHVQRDLANPVQMFDLTEPPSTNALYRNRTRAELDAAAKRGKRLPGRAKTDRYRTWLNANGWLLKGARRMDGPALITILARSGRKDIDNLTKACLDLLVKHKVLVDDGPAYVAGVNLRWSDVVGGVRIVVESAE